MQCFRGRGGYHTARCLPCAGVLHSGRQSQRAQANLLTRGQRRAFLLDSIPVMLQPPVVFGGLLVTLWTYKCLMMVIFQNKIIYMPSVPPFSRSEKVGDYARQCAPITWTEHDIKATDGTAIKLLESCTNAAQEKQRQPHVVVLYLQGWVSEATML